MREAKFKIGDCVKSLITQNGKVTDIMYSSIKDEFSYEVFDIDSGDITEIAKEDELKLLEAPTSYGFDVNVSGNVAVVTMTATQGLKTHVCARGHAHILHDGDVGIAQAVSYAAKRMFESLDTKQENAIYFKGGI